MGSNFDNLLDSLQNNQGEQLKKLGDRIAKVRRMLSLSLASGEVSKIRKAIDEAQALMSSEMELHQQILHEIDTFDFQAYLASQFETDLLANCRAKDIPIQGRYPHYIVASFTVEVAPDGHQVEVNGRKLELSKIGHLVAQIESELSELQKNGISPEQFAAKMAEAYDWEVQSSTGKSSTDIDGLEVPLINLYNHLVPDKVDRLKYSIRQFSYDINRMLNEGIDSFAGRKFIFKAGRNRSKTVRVVLPSGVETYYGSLSLMKS